MIACYAWSNLQIINVTNAAANLYSDSKADLFIRMGPHISQSLIAALERSGVYEHVHCIDPLYIDCKKTPLGKIPKVRILATKSALRKAYGALLGHLCGETVYERALLPWFFADSVFFLDYWAKYNPKLAISFVEEGTSSYSYSQKQMCFSLFNAPTFAHKLIRYFKEGAMMRRFKHHVDTLCLYRPEYSQPDITFEKRALPTITEDTNPAMYSIMCNAVAELDNTHYIRYEKRNIIYFSSYSIADPEFERQSASILNSIVKKAFNKNIICKVHTHSTTHAQKFAQDVQDRIFVDREKYIFEGLYMQLPNREKKIFVSCVSTTALNTKFMFGVEPYVIFTYRLYSGYRQNAVTGDDWLANSLLDAYEDKSRVMIPNSVHEFEEMIKACVASD